MSGAVSGILIGPPRQVIRRRRSPPGPISWIGPMRSNASCRGHNSRKISFLLIPPRLRCESWRSSIRMACPMKARCFTTYQTTPACHGKRLLAGRDWRHKIVRQWITDTGEARDLGHRHRSATIGTRVPGYMPAGVMWGPGVRDGCRRRVFRSSIHGKAQPDKVRSLRQARRSRRIAPIPARGFRARRATFTPSPPKSGACSGGQDVLSSVSFQDDQPFSSRPRPGTLYDHSHSPVPDDANTAGFRRRHPGHASRGYHTVLPTPDSWSHAI